MSFLVISRTHGLLPFAYRLKNEGENVEALVSVPAFERSWQGKIQKVLRNSKGEINPEVLGPSIKLAEAGEVVVLTDDWQIETVFGNAQKKFGACQLKEPTPAGHLRVGLWFDGETASAPHLLVVDEGLWTGGLGAQVDAGLTMIRVDNPEVATLIEDLTQPTLQHLKSQGFRGLVQAGVEFNTPDGGPGVRGAVAGWPWLQTHAFLSELEGFAGVLRGAHKPSIPRKFTTVLPVTQPPWPNKRAQLRKRTQPIDSLTPKQMARTFFHDIVVDEQARKLATAGLDGLVGVTRGAADTSELARALALETAVRLQLEEKQYREDVGALVQKTLAQLEAVFGVWI